jgi:hypothetical protein
MLAAGLFSPVPARSVTHPRSARSTLLDVPPPVARTLPAHHSFETEFDVKKRITLHGTVTKVVWASPHAWIHLDVKDSNGRVVTWAIQAAAPSVLATHGWRRSSVLPGMFITIDAFLSRDGTPTVNGRDVTFPDGRKLCANIPCACCRQGRPLKTRYSRLNAAQTISTSQPAAGEAAPLYGATL